MMTGEGSLCQVAIFFELGRVRRPAKPASCNASITTTQDSYDKELKLTTEDRLEQRDKGVLLTIYFCESCNMVLDLGDPEAQQHKIDKPNHKMRRVQVVHCAHCGQIVTDSYAQYSLERGQFWCKNCVHGRVEAFHTP